MQLDFLSELAFRADAVAVADDEHPDHELGVDRRTADVAVMGLVELLVQVGERHGHTQQMVLGDAIFEPELAEQTPLIPPLHDLLFHRLCGRFDALYDHLRAIWLERRLPSRRVRQRRGSRLPGIDQTAVCLLGTP